MLGLYPVCGASFMQGGGRSGRRERMVPALSGEAGLGASFQLQPTIQSEPHGRGVMPKSKTSQSKGWWTGRLKSLNWDLQLAIVFERDRVRRTCGLLLFAGRLYPVVDSTPSFGRSLYIENSIFLAWQRVIVDEKFLKLSNKLFSQIAHASNVGKAMIGLLHGDYSIVTLFVTLLALLTLNHADHLALQKAAWEGGFIHQY